MHRFFLSVVLLIVVLISDTLIFAQDHQWVDPLAELLTTGEYEEMAVEGDRLYIATDYGLEVHDISDPSAPEMIVRYPSIRDSEDIAVRDSIVFLVDWSWGLHVLDTRDPADITETFSHENDQSIFQDVAVEGDYLYLCEYDFGVWIYDISDPLEPQQVTRISTSRYPSAVFARDTILFVADVQNDIINIVDVSDPEDWVVIDWIDHQNGWAYDLTVQDDILFIAQGTAGLSAYNIADLFDTRRLWLLEFGNGQSVRSVDVSGELVSASAYGIGLQVVDISNIDEPETIFADDTTLSYPRDAIINEDHIYTCASEGLVVYHIDEQVEIEFAATKMNSPIVYDITFGNDLLFVSRYEEGIMIFDIEDPSEPQFLSQIDTISVNRVMATSDGWLYLGTHYVGDTINYMDVWNVEDVQDIHGVWRTEISDDFPVLNIENDIFIVGTNETGIHFWDISQRDQPELISNFEDAPGRRSSLEGNILYMLTRDIELHVYDVSNLEEPDLIDTWDDLEYAFNIESDSSYVYVADGDEGVVILDAANPANLRSGQTIRAKDFCVDMTVDDTLLYVCDFAAGLRLYDLTTGFRPSEIGYFDTPGKVSRVHIYNGVAYVADRTNLTICKYNPASGVFEDYGSVPFSTTLHPALPNPFNSATKISYTLPQSGNVSIQLFNPLGEKVGTIFEGGQQSGAHTAAINVEHLPSGMYFVRLNTEDQALTQKVMLIR